MIHRTCNYRNGRKRCSNPRYTFPFHIRRSRRNICRSMSAPCRPNQTCTTPGRRCCNSPYSDRVNRSSFDPKTGIRRQDVRRSLPRKDFPLSSHDLCILRSSRRPLRWHSRRFPRFHIDKKPPPAAAPSRLLHFRPSISSPEGFRSQPLPSADP